MSYERNCEVALLILAIRKRSIYCKGKYGGRKKRQWKIGDPNGIKLNNTQFTRSNETGNNQINVIVNYSMSDPALIGQEINAVMKVYSADGSLLKTTSFPLDLLIC
jgi:hypothetical protein